MNDDSETARSQSTHASREGSVESSNTLLNALVGAIVTAVTTPLVPFAPVLGGAVAGYLESDGTDGKVDSGVKVGAISGAIALVPLLVIIPFLLFFLFLDPVIAVSVFAIATIAVAFLAAYTVGFSALGGLLGVYLREEFGGEHDGW